MDPVKKMLYDIDYNDLSYSEFRKDSGGFDKRIVIVNIKDTSRGGIAAIIQKISSYQPKVIGLDALFEQPVSPLADSILIATLGNTPDLVLCNRINDTGTIGLFNQYAGTSGYANFYGEKGNVIRYFTPFKAIKSARHRSFAAAVTAIADPDAFAALRKRNKPVEVINYRRPQSKYLVIEPDALFEDKITGENIRNKIVLVGLITNNPFSIKDKYFTPMNPQFLGKSAPDNFGIIIHANIISMILDHDYVYSIPWWLRWVIAIIIGWLYVAIFIHYFINKPIWFHAIVASIELVSVIIFIFLGLALFNYFDIRIDLTETIGVLLFSSWVLYFYQGIVSWLQKRYKTTLFNPNHS